MPSALTKPAFDPPSLLRALAADLERPVPGRRPLLSFAVALLPLAFAATVLLFVDPRVLDGAPLWLKPLKFALSNALFAATLAWLLGFVPDRPRLTRRVGWALTSGLAIENALIVLQAARGVRSHFNSSSVRDAIIVSVMGATILVVMGFTAALAVALVRQPLYDAPLASAIRSGLWITIAGAFIGALMTPPPSASSIAAARAGRLPVMGAHTVGGPDGGPGLPLTHWSSTHGDLRVPHFLGLHAVQVLPLLAWVLSTGGRPVPQRVRLVRTAAFAYAMLIAILLWQALRAESLAAPGGTTLAALGGWLALALLGTLVALRPTATEAA
jgi:hypothetical protein